MKAPRVTPLEGVSTHGAAMRVVWESRTARFRSENPQCFGMINADMLLWFIRRQAAPHGVWGLPQRLLMKNVIY